MFFAAIISGHAQENSSGEIAPANNNVAQPAKRSEAKRLFGVIPNFRTSDTLNPYVPISPKQKFHIAAQDAFDRGTFALAAAFAGVDMKTGSERSYGGGVEGYSKYFGASYADFAVGDFMTEGIFPTLLHQDPRYFRMGCCSSAWKRFGYAFGQILWTHSDSGKGQFNFSEVGGNATAVAISEIYYRDNRSAGNAISSLGNQLLVDALANVAKEFWPEIDRALSHKHPEPEAAP